jgi:pimeloyl-ACP methyl ester carboxylesterase
MDQLGLERAHVVAASMGGWIAMNFAIDHPQRIRSLALLGPLGFNSAKDVIFRLMQMVLVPTRENKEAFTHWVLGEHPVVRTAYTEYMTTALDCRSKLGTPGDLPDEQLRRLSVPVLVMLGGKDNPIGDAQRASERARRLIPQVEVEIFPASGHLVNTEHPEQVNARILEFFGAAPP